MYRSRLGDVEVGKGGAYHGSGAKVRADVDLDIGYDRRPKCRAEYTVHELDISVDRGSTEMKGSTHAVAKPRHMAQISLNSLATLIVVSAVPAFPIPLAS